MKTGKELLAIGIDLGGTNIKSGISDINGYIYFRRSDKTPVSKGSRAVIDSIINVGEELLNFAKKENLKIKGIGIGSPGGIDIDRGIPLGSTPNIPDWKGVKIKDTVTRSLGLPCVVDNDANMFMFAEHMYGAARGYENAVGLTIGTGIGGGLIINGCLFRGSGFLGAEIGHIPIVVNGRKCKCGLKGCFESYASAIALEKTYRRSTPKSKLTAEEIFNLAKTGDSIANKAIDEWSDYLASGIAVAVNLLNPQIVVLGGGVSRSGNFLLEKVRRSLKDKVIPESLSILKLKISKLGNDAGWLGAASMSIRQR